MQEEDLLTKLKEWDIKVQPNTETLKKHLPEVIKQPVSVQNTFFKLLPSDVDLSVFYKSLDISSVNFDTKESIQALFNGAVVCEKPFPFGIFLLEWINKKAQNNFVIFLLDNKIDLGSSSLLTKVVKPDYITESVYYLNCVELYKGIAYLNNRSLILRIKQECPEMCVLGLSHILPKFADIFDELFLKTIDKYRQTNSIYSSGKNENQYTDFKNSFYFYQESNIVKNINMFSSESMVMQAQKEELKLSEKQTFILNILLIQKKVIYKLSLVPFHIALLLIVENNCFEQVFSLNSDLSYNMLLLGTECNLFDLRSVLGCKIKNDLFIHNLLIFISTKNISYSITVINALLPLVSNLKPDTLGVYNKLRERVENYYLFQHLSNINFYSISDDEMLNNFSEYDENLKNSEKMVYPKHFKMKIKSFTPEELEKIDEKINLLHTFRSQITERNIEPFKNIKRLKRLAAGNIYQRNFLNKLVSYLINNLDPFIEELYEEGLLCPNQSIIASKIISFYKFKNNKINIPIIKEKSKFTPQSLGLESIPKNIIQTYEQLYIFKLENFENDFMTKYILNFQITEKFLEVVNYFNNLRNEKFKYFFIKQVFDLLKTFLNNTSDLTMTIELGNLEWFINLGILISEFTFRKHLMFDIETFDIKAIIQKCSLVNCTEIIYFISYLLLNSKDFIFNANLRYLQKILEELIQYKEEIPFIKLRFVKDDSENEIVCRFKYFNDNFTENDNLKRIIMDYFNFTFIPSTVTNKSDYLANYILPNNLYSSIILMAIDVSVRDICKILIERTISATEKTVHEIQRIYNYKGGNNLFLNLSTRLIHVNAFEPLISCIKNNIINFLKLCNLDVNKISVTTIIQENIQICVNLLKREVFTRINNNNYFKERNIQEGKVQINLKLLNNLNSYEPISIKELKDEDLEKVKGKLTGITRDIPNTKLYLLTEQWKKLIFALESYEGQINEIDYEDLFLKFENSNEFKKENKFNFFLELKEKKEALIFQCKTLLNLLRNSEQTDSLAETLCKHIMGYLQHNTSFFMFVFLNEIFKISFNSFLAVKHYLSYSSLPFNRILYLAIEKKIVSVLEFDQLNSIEKNQMKFTEEEVLNLKNIISLLVLRNKKVCTIYDFVYSLEKISKQSTISFIDFMVVNLKSFNLNESQVLFEEFIFNNRFTFLKKKIFPSENLNFLYDSFNLSWDHFLRNHRKPTEYPFLKIDTLIDNTDDSYNLLIVLKDLIEHSNTTDNFVLHTFVNRALFKVFKRFNLNYPFNVLFNAIINIPHFYLQVYHYSPLSLQYLLLIIETLNSNNSLLNGTLVYFTKMFLYSSNPETEIENNIEIIKQESFTEYKYVTEEFKYKTEDKPIQRNDIVINLDFNYIKIKKENLLICKCKNCEKINCEYPLIEDNLKREGYSYKVRGFDTEENINLFEIINLGCKKYFSLLNYFISPTYPELKNMFMVTHIPNMEGLKKLDYFKIRTLLNKKISAWAFRKYKGYIIAVVDSLCNNYYDEIYLITKEDYKVTELINCLQSRAWCYNTPGCIVKALDIVVSNLERK